MKQLQTIPTPQMPLQTTQRHNKETAIRIQITITNAIMTIEVQTTTTTTATTNQQWVHPIKFLEVQNQRLVM